MPGTVETFSKMNIMAERSLSTLEVGSSNLNISDLYVIIPALGK